MKTIKYIICLIVISLTFSSCGIYTSYKRPTTIATENLYRQSDSELSESTDTTRNMANLHWKALFTDTLLQSYIQTGLQQNTDLRIAQLRIDQAQANLNAAKLTYLPSLSLNGQGGINSIGGERATRTHSETLLASWEIDFFGKIRNSNAQIRAQLEQSIDYRQAVQSQLIATIASNYYTLAMLHGQLQISEQTLSNWAENIRVIQAMKGAGMATEAAVSQSEGNYHQVNASVLELQQQIRELENSFSALLGNVSQEIRIDKNIDKGLYMPVLSVGVPMDLLANRPDVRQSENELKYAFYGTNTARAAFYPTITLGGNAGWSNNLGTAISNPAQFLASAVGSLVQPLFSQGRLTAQLKIAKSQQEEAVLNFQQSLLDAGVEINNALSAYQTSRLKSEAYEQQISALENAVRSTRLLMQHSSSSYLEVLTAQQSLLAAQLIQIDNKFSEAQNAITLYRALGGGATE